MTHTDWEKHTMKLILLIEDNESDEVLTVRALEKAKVANEIQVVRDGEEALAYLFGTGVHAGRDLTQLPTVVLLDLNLPKLRGEEFLADIKRHPEYCSIPVVAISGSVNRADMKMAYKLGANAYMRKPIDLDQLDEFVQALAKFWLDVAELPDECSAQPTRTATAAQS